MLKLISSLEKCFLDESIATKEPLEKASLLKNEVFRFGACYTLDKDNICTKEIVTLHIDSSLAEYIKVWKVDHVPMKMVAERGKLDADHLRSTPGLYPDLLTPLRQDNRLMVCENLESLYFELDTKGKVATGEYTVTIQLIDENSGDIKEQKSILLNIIDALLPAQEIAVTQWFHCDCLQNYYATESFDERHWQVIEKFIKTAVEHGINMILTPVFTPPLDTHIGGERTTTQLVDVEVINGKYHFNFQKLSRWVDLCNKLGVKYFEISHFFTQWGACHAPKVMATVDGEKKRIFGWETDATGAEYVKFLRSFIPQLIAFMKSKNDADKRCWFHISDEPMLEHLTQYSASRTAIIDLLQGYPVIDALSNYQAYKKGIIETPIVATDHITPFIEHNVKNLWCYYCIAQWNKVSNRFISMPAYRTRIIGTQFYKYNITGFLHWGYNFYNNQGSYGSVNPYVITDGEYFSPAGDTFSVYPASNGEALPSMRLKLFHDALQDLAALKLCESLYDRKFVLNLMESNEMPITFSEYPRTTAYIPNLREKINTAIVAKVTNANQ